MKLSARPADGEAGFTTVELMAALSILTVGFFALAGALGFGLRQVTLGRQRQTATEVANGRIEHLRNVPYEAVALSSQPLHDEDPDSPDHFVSSDNTQFDISANGDFEDLIVDDAGGQVLHLEDPVQVGTTTMEIWQYATWFDQANNVKRLTVVVVYKPQVLGPSRMVRASTFFTPGTVTIEGTDSGATQGSGSPTPSAAPTPTPTGSCSGDGQAPTGSFTIASLSGQTDYTASTSVTLTMSLSDACAPIQARFSNNDGTTWGEWITYDASNASVTWSLTAGDGGKDVDAEVRDALGQARLLFTPDIILDTTPPTVPGTMARTLSCSGSNRTVNLSWGASTDLHFSGYRVYVSVNSGAWTMLTSTAMNSASHTHQKTLDSVRFYAVGYDQAGNESNATNTVSLSKNQCS
jgi:hypothetical protein